MPANIRLNGMSLFFSRSAEQQADLNALVAAQRDIASPLYHQWLTPDQFAARFGMADADLARVQGWLVQQGFSIDSVARSRNSIHFSGNVNQVEQAFSTQMHLYNVEGKQHFAPSTELSLPAALAPVVLAVRNLTDFRPKPMHILPAHPSFTSGQSGDVFFAPGDIKVAYNIPSAYTGAEQSIAIMGQSAVLVSDIENFQSAAHLTTKDPTLVLVPGTGNSAGFSGDETESDLDLEWSGAMAPGASIFFVYTGSDENSGGVFTSMQYAVDENIAPIISLSYGTCETELSTSDLQSSELMAQQAVAQGQTIIASSGDSGSTACAPFSNLTLLEKEAEAVSYPASSEFVTGLGGTETTAAEDKTGAGYWASSGTDDLTSALQYIPEVAWNDDSGQYGLSSSGGGISTVISRPDWQAGVTGIPAGATRVVPDIALYSSPNYPGYLFCTSDPESEIEGSCSNGFRDANNDYLTVAGGTSFAAPIFAGMLALINQAKGYSTGQGLINPTLYTLAANGTIYGSAFHDVTSGSNDCTAGSTYCGSTAGFSAGTGYDEVTGLGSVNLANLIAAWPTNTGSSDALIGTSTTISTAATTPAIGANVNFTITVVAASGSASPMGTVNLSINGGGTGESNGGITATANLVASTTPGISTASYSYTFYIGGANQIVAQYAGDSTFAQSSGVVQVCANGCDTATGNIALAPTPSTLNVTQGNQGTETIAITPLGGYTGTVLLYLNTSNNTALQNLCLLAQNVTNGNASVIVGGGIPVRTQLIFDTNASDCAATTTGAARTSFHRLGGIKAARNGGAHPAAANPTPLGVAFAGLLLAGLLGRYSKKFHGTAGMIALLAVALAISACGGGSSSTTTVITPPNNDPPKGTYTITVMGQDSNTSLVSGVARFTFVIQ
ncbi:MAG: protease pro-enzyme activation domain-containing protein [Terracidiphilus sp.]|jgi:subtilase family serine protease